MENGVANEILVDEQEDAGVMIAVRNLQNDFKRVRKVEAFAEKNHIPLIPADATNVAEKELQASPH